MAENKTLVEKAIDILKGFGVEPTNDILEQLNKIEQGAISKESFVDSVIELLTELLADTQMDAEI